MRAAIGNAWRGAAGPLLWYYAIAVVVPLVNGASLRDAPVFEHLCFVVLVPPALLTLVGALRGLRR